MTTLLFLILTNHSLSCLQPCSMTDALCLPDTTLAPFAHNKGEVGGGGEGKGEGLLL